MPVVRETVIGGVRVTGVFPAFPGDTAVEGVPGAEPGRPQRFLVNSTQVGEFGGGVLFCEQNRLVCSHSFFARFRRRWTLQKKGSNSVSSVGLLSEVADEKHLLPGAPRGSMLAL